MVTDIEATVAHDGMGPCGLVKGQWDHCRTAEYTIKVIEKFIHGAASGNETTAVSNRGLCPESPFSKAEKHRQDQGTSCHHFDSTNTNFARIESE